MTGLICCTLKCNMACQYCYEGNGRNLCAPNLAEINQKFEDAIPLFIDLIDQLYAHNQNTTTKVIWHGGEPMLIRPQLMEQVMLDQLQKGHDIRWEMQSNGTLVTDEHIRVFQKYKVSVGVSIDGLKKHHDKYRIFKNGNPTYDVIMKNTQRLRNSGISCGTLLTITDENVNDLPEIYQELCKKNLNFSFNALFPSKADDDVTLSLIHISEPTRP